jgi:hypothetical protein
MSSTGNGTIRTPNAGTGNRAVAKRSKIAVAHPAGQEPLNSSYFPGQHQSIRFETMQRRSLYKYYSDQRWADDFLNGKLLFRSLSYFRDYEDKQVREDQKEGTSVFRLSGGLVINNLTQGTTFVAPEWGFESSAKHEEIFVFCLSRSHTEERRRRFNAVACVEILNIGAFCRRVEAALPPGATFPAQAGRPPQIGHRVTYYPETQSGPRWALPEMIATSKLDAYAWQDEFRLVFSLTDALGFEKVQTRLVHRNNPREAAKPAEHHCYEVSAQSMRDICRLHKF